MKATLDDGREIPGVLVSWSKVVVGVQGGEAASFDADRVVDVRLEPGRLGDEFTPKTDAPELEPREKPSPRDSKEAD